MTFLEAAQNILAREGKPLHFKDLTERALGKKLLTFVGRTPEVTMQTQLTAAVKKAPGNPFVRVKPGVFGLLRYPELPPEEPPVPEKDTDDDQGKEPKAKADDGDRKERGEDGLARADRDLPLRRQSPEQHADLAMSRHVPRVPSGIGAVKKMNRRGRVPTRDLW